MKRGQSGFTLVELSVAVAMMAVISATAAMAIHQVSKGTEYSNKNNPLEVNSLGTPPDIKGVLK